jgi:hypothetical protein
MTGRTNPDRAAPPDMPPSLAARPTDARRGLPIPPVNLFTADTDAAALRVDFTTINTRTSAALAAARRCSLCGTGMGYWVAFLGTARTAELRRYADPPGHPDCMRAAVTLCPHIALARHRRARADRPGGGTMPQGSHGDKPEAWILGITRTYRSMFLPADRYTIFFPAPFRTTETYAYGPDGHVTRQHP